MWTTGNSAQRAPGSGHVAPDGDVRALCGTGSFLDADLPLRDTTPVGETHTMGSLTSQTKCKAGAAIYKGFVIQVT